MPQQEKDRALAPAMAIPSRNASVENAVRPVRTFFATTKTSMGRRLFQVERNAALLIDVLRSLVGERVFKLHDFVIMPDHMHLLLSVKDSMTIEKAMQMVKGRFSYRLKKELGIAGEVWQRGFSEVQVLDRASFEAHRAYIAENPAKARLVSAAGEYAFCYEALARKKSEARVAVAQGLKPD